MLDSLIKLIIGDMEDKRAYKSLMKRVDALPKDYRYAFRKMQHYMFTVGPPDGDMNTFTDLKLFTELVELLEESAAEGKNLLDVVGKDVSAFCDDFMAASSVYTKNNDKLREQLNNEIKDRVKREEQQ